MDNITDVEQGSNGIRLISPRENYENFLGRKCVSTNEPWSNAWKLMLVLSWKARNFHVLRTFVPFVRDA